MIEPIGVVRSCFGDKFAIPRQAGLAPEARAWVELDARRVAPEALRGLEGFSHVWVVFGFHAAGAVKTTVRPPRIAWARRAGEPLAARVGVLATRSPHRPNHLGLSAVRLLRVEGLRVEVGGVDILDGSPVYDVKPYLPYADAIPEARGGWAVGELPHGPVRFGAEAEVQLAGDPDLRALLTRVLALDPRRPGARDGAYRFRLAGWDVGCRVDDGVWTVEALVPLDVGRG